MCGHSPHLLAMLYLALFTLHLKLLHVAAFIDFPVDVQPATPLACDFHPCSNGGTCTNVRMSFSCTCTPAYTGPTCEDAVYSCEEGWSGEGARCYRVFDSRLTWFEAVQSCRRLHRANLVSIHSDAENDQVARLVSAVTAPATWIGLSDLSLRRRPSGFGWRWEDRSPFDYAQWQASQPTSDPSAKLEDCGSMMSTGMWGIFPENYDVDNYEGCYAELPYMCAKPAATPCDPQPCANGGICKALPGGKYQCSCSRLFSGQRCEKCECMNGGECPSIKQIEKTPIAERDGLKCTCNPHEKDLPVHHQLQEDAQWHGVVCQFSSRCAGKVRYLARLCELEAQAADTPVCALCADASRLEGGLFCQLEIMSVCHEHPSMPVTVLFHD